MKDRQHRLMEVYEYVREHFAVHTKKGFAYSIKITLPALYSAFGGNERYLTDRFFKRICEAYPDVFSLDYLLHGTGSLLLDQEKGVGDYFPSTVSEPTPQPQAAPIPQWAASLISILSQQIKENEALHRELRQTIQELHQLIHTLKTSQPPTPPPPNEVSSTIITHP